MLVYRRVHSKAIVEGFGQAHFHSEKMPGIGSTCRRYSTSFMFWIDTYPVKNSMKSEAKIKNPIKHTQPTQIQIHHPENHIKILKSR